ncbi:type II toxin-antitoxin system RelB/DinJ family antitoxin [Gardnerella swidsinskii]|uniref:type II toxin-antitoxin system RelB/DinJ family antitoxin n=1 Tax=Gardnerella swidsinskii TaxID=2792979 RepID=UPI000E320904|nr:type II toxin-antitoxin system RelB/DinJ family antitoxin [uncultured Gardnerella sp.]RFD72853.1 translation repressor RelB [Gardnerella vaginalis]RFT35812.1 type II toxin-antitoxin system antitoxin, RelB/DinJ family [Bifidobacteriaceae bacterium NR020]
MTISATTTATATPAAAKTAAKTANINVRVTKDVKAQAEELFASFGITLSEAINMFLHKSLMVEGLPFDLKQPEYNKETIAAFKEAKDILSGQVPAKRYNSVSEMMDDVFKED